MQGKDIDKFRQTGLDTRIVYENARGIGFLCSLTRSRSIRDTRVAVTILRIREGANESNDSL